MLHTGNGLGLEHIVVLIEHSSPVVATGGLTLLIEIEDCTKFTLVPQVTNFFFSTNDLAASLARRFLKSCPNEALVELRQRFPTLGSKQQIQSLLFFRELLEDATTCSFQEVAECAELAIHSTNEEVRRLGAQLISHYEVGPLACDTAETLTLWLTDQTKEGEWALLAEHALLSIRTKSEPSLKNALLNPWKVIRKAGFGDEQSIPLVQMRACKLLEHLQCSNPEIAGTLVELLESPWLPLSWAASEALCYQKSLSLELLTKVFAVYLENHVSRTTLEKTLFGYQSYVWFLTQLIQKGSPSEQAIAAESIRRLALEKPDFALSAIEPLLKALPLACVEVQTRIATALGAFGCIVLHAICPIMACYRKVKEEELKIYFILSAAAIQFDEPTTVNTLTTYPDITL